ncbi:MAG: CapA family protein [Candidatus Marinimicrobia bacterium]|nr:CapA family protein [Candidatus Neomarinimicrobiota bacterium]
MLKIAILGDFIQTPEFDIDKALLKILQGTDFNIANLEAPFIHDNSHPSNGRSGLYQKISNCDLLKKLNIKIVSLANNHISDFGLEGFQYTKELLKENDILYFGAGEDQTEAEAPVVYEFNGMKISVRGAMSRYLTRFHAGEDRFGTADINAKKISEALKQDHSDIKIVYNHWNQEYEDFPEPIYKEDAEGIIDYADLIAGSHSHCIQGIEEVNKKPIFYSLGNFSLPNIDYYQCRISPYRSKSYHSFFPLITFSETGVSYEIIPYVLNPNGSILSTPSKESQETIREQIKIISIPLNLKQGEYLKFYMKHRDRKMRKPLTRNHKRNSMNLKGYRLKYKVVHGIESGSAKILDKLGLRKLIRKRFAAVIDKIQKAK